MIGVSHGRLDELSRNRRLSRSKNYPSLLFALGLGLSRQASCKATGITTSRISTDFTEMPQSAVLRPISLRNRSSWRG